jgi:predicted small secreted protein
MISKQKITLGLIAIILHAAVILTACTNAAIPQGKPLPEMTYVQLEPVSIDVLEIDKIVKAELSSPYNIYFKPSPKRSLERYLRQRFRPNGRSEALLEIAVSDISLTEKKISEDSANPLWPKNRTIVYLTLRYEIFYVYGKNGVKQSSLTASRSTVIHDDMSLAAREFAMQELINNLILDADEELVKNVLLITTNMPK